MKIFAKNILVSLFCASMVACGSSGGGGDDDDDGGSTPSLTEIDDKNGGEIMSSTLAGISTYRGLKSTDDASQVHTAGTISFIRSLIGSQGSSSTDNNIGLKVETEDCTISGDITDDFTEVDAPPIFEETGTSVADECVEPLGGSGTLTINGEINYDVFENDFTGAFNDSADGFITLELKGVSGQPDTTFGFTNFNFAISGNDGPPETFEVSSLNYTFEFDNDNISFFVTLEVTDNIVESNGDGCPESGTVVITGSNGTNVTGTFDGATVNVSINGNPATAIACVF